MSPNIQNRGFHSFVGHQNLGAILLRLHKLGKQLIFGSRVIAQMETHLDSEDMSILISEIQRRYKIAGMLKYI